jgi:anaerobic ribonucleoside-triphosphate reductase activating protein
MRINYILEKSFVQGPGERFCIWVQGCSIHCNGCKNIDTWDPRGGKECRVFDLVNKIKNSTSTGITISGGEPLDQFKETLELVKNIKLNTDKNIFLCTGYTTETVNKKFKEILSFLDIICTGPFDKNKICSGFLKGSINQEVIGITKIGKELLTKNVLKKEIRINKKTGERILTGFSS